MAEKSENWFARSRDYVSEVQAEFKKITWPPQSEMINGTISVLVIVTLIATFLGVVDFGLSRMMQMVLG
jgi:preprotein translocase subunit SecE